LMSTSEYRYLRGKLVASLNSSLHGVATALDGCLHELWPKEKKAGKNYEGYLYKEVDF